MDRPDAYLRDVSRVSLHLSEQEAAALREALTEFAKPDSDLWYARGRLLLPRKKASKLKDEVQSGWNALDNRDLWTAFHALISQQDALSDDLRERVSSASVALDRVDPAAMKGRRGAEWESRRQEILKRDGGECVRCGSSPEKLHVHHCIPFQRHNTIEGANRDGNLETLCLSCHPKVESHDSTSLSQHSQRKLP